MRSALLLGLLAFAGGESPEDVIAVRVVDRLGRPVEAVLCPAEPAEPEKPCANPISPDDTGLLHVKRAIRADRLRQSCRTARAAGAEHPRAILRAPGFRDAPLDLSPGSAKEVTVRLFAKGRLHASFLASDPAPGEPLTLRLTLLTLLTPLTPLTLLTPLTPAGDTARAPDVTLVREAAPGRAEEILVDDLPAATYRLDWSGTGALPGSTTFPLAIGAEARLPAVVLERVPRVTGRVVDDTGAPVAGARVVPAYTWREPPPRFSVSKRGAPVATAADGRFVVLRERPSAVLLVVKAAGLRGSQASVEAHSGLTRAPDLDVGDVALSRGRVLRGTVTYLDSGRPLERAKVVVYSRGKLGRSAAFEAVQETTLTDASGSYEVRGLDEREGIVLSVSAAGYATAVRDVEEEIEIDVALGRGGAIEGVLCGTDAEKAATTVAIDAPVPGGESRQVRVDVSGRFELDRLEPGLYTVRRLHGAADAGSPISVPTGESAQVEVASGRRSQVRLGCKAIAVSGQVLLDGRPAPGLVVTLVNIHATASVFTSDEAGRFEVTVDAPGRHVARVLVRPASTEDGARTGLAWCDVPPNGMSDCLLGFPVLAPIDSPGAVRP